jgi:hypothetical protein
MKLEAWWIKEVDAPLGVYFVFMTKNGDEKQIVALPKITPLSHLLKILNRSIVTETILNPIPTAEHLYKQNQNFG